MLHADWAIVLFLVLSKLKNIVTSNKLHYISNFTLLVWWPLTDREKTLKIL